MRKYSIAHDKCWESYGIPAASTSKLNSTVASYFAVVSNGLAVDDERLDRTTEAVALQDGAVPQLGGKGPL